MKLYINDKYLHLLKHAIPEPDSELKVYHSLEGLFPGNLAGSFLLRNTTEQDIAILLSWIELKKVPHLRTVLCDCVDYPACKDFIKAQFRIVHAAGGLVQKRDKILLIFRLGKWDLPKGKLERGEKTREAAIREVNEECGIEVELIDKLCTTWHTYIQEGKRILKKTTWFTMNCLDDSQMEPQYVENIEDIRWMGQDQVDTALQNSYRSIEGVLEAWYKKTPPPGV